SVVPEPALPPPDFFPLPLPLLAPPSAPAPSLSVTSEVVVILTSVTRPLASLVIDIDMPWTDPVPPVLRPIWPVSSEFSCRSVTYVLVSSDSSSGVPLLSLVVTHLPEGLIEAATPCVVISAWVVGALPPVAEIPRSPFTSPVTFTPLKDVEGTGG